MEDIRYFARTEVGAVRGSNEDSYLLDPEFGLFIVADGMGGHRNGKLASKLACSIFFDFFKSNIEGVGKGISRPQILSILREGFLVANQGVYGRNSEKTGRSAMGTTLAAVYIHGSFVYFGNIGDTRIILVDDSGGSVFPLSVDHTLSAQMARGGTPSPIASHYRNSLTMAVGTQRAVDPNVGMVPFMKGWSILICSDGLYCDVRDAQFSEAVVRPDYSLKEKVDGLFDLAMGAGGTDNATAILVRWAG